MALSRRGFLGGLLAAPLATKLPDVTEATELVPLEGPLPPSASWTALPSPLPRNLHLVCSTGATPLVTIRGADQV